jgi:hypothetical protein
VLYRYGIVHVSTNDTVGTLTRTTKILIFYESTNQCRYRSMALEQAHHFYTNGLQRRAVESKLWSSGESSALVRWCSPHFPEYHLMHPIHHVLLYAVQTTRRRMRFMVYDAVVSYGSHLSVRTVCCADAVTSIGSFARNILQSPQEETGPVGREYVPPVQARCMVPPRWRRRVLSYRSRLINVQLVVRNTQKSNG